MRPPLTRKPSEGSAVKMAMTGRMIKTTEPMGLGGSGPWTPLVPLLIGTWLLCGHCLCRDGRYERTGHLRQERTVVGG